MIRKLRVLIFGALAFVLFSSVNVFCNQKMDENFQIQFFTKDMAMTNIRNNCYFHNFSPG